MKKSLSKSKRISPRGALSNRLNRTLLADLEAAAARAGPVSGSKGIQTVCKGGIWHVTVTQKGWQVRLVDTELPQLLQKALDLHDQMRRITG